MFSTFRSGYGRESLTGSERRLTSQKISSPQAIELILKRISGGGFPMENPPANHNIQLFPANLLFVSVLWMDRMDT
jgi:hypothetical protein